MKPIAQVVREMPRSGIRELMDRAALLEGVIHLEVGEPSFGTPAHVVEAAFEDTRAGYTKYTANAGLPSLRAAVAERASRQWGRTVGPDEVLVTAGAVNALAASILTLAEAGDEVLLPDPGWPNPLGMVQLSGADPRFYALRPEDSYLPDPERVAAIVTDRTKLLLMNNPSNPTGAVFPHETVAALVRLAAERDLYVIADEIYADLVFEGAHTWAAPHDPDGRVIAIGGCSKTYAMTGWRIGWAITRPELVTLMGKLQESLVSCPSSVSQRAAEAAIRGPQEAVGEMRDAYRRRRDLVRELLEPAGFLATVPRGAFYAMADLRRLGKSGRDLALALLDEEQVACAPGETFGAQASGMLRISLATDDEALAEGCRRLLHFAERHAAVLAETRPAAVSTAT
jgi:aspartate/methionine/tyrosine aminotransferase